MAKDKHQDEFRQRVAFSGLRAFVPDLYDRIFDPNYRPPQDPDHPEDGVFFPTSAEEFEAMMAEAEWDQ